MSGSLSFCFCWSQNQPGHWGKTSQHLWLGWPPTGRTRAGGPALRSPPLPCPPVALGLAGPLTASSSLCCSTSLDGVEEASVLLVRSPWRQLCGFSGDLSFVCRSSLHIQSPCQHRGSASCLRSPRVTRASDPESKTSSSWWAEGLGIPSALTSRSVSWAQKQ